MSTSSAHIAPGNGGYIAHNSRESWSNSQVFFDEPNELWNNKEEAFKLFREELAARTKKYTERTKQKLHKKTKTHLSMVVNLEKHHNLDDLKKLTDWLEKSLDTKVFQVAIHRDEGKLVHKETGQILTSGEHFFANPENQKLYFDAEFKEQIDMSEWNIEKNYHAHIEFLGLKSDGKSIKRELSTHFFRQLQDKTAEILGMERGKRTVPNYTKEQMTEIKKALKPKKEYENEKAYGKAFTAMAKELGYWKPKQRRAKRLDTHDFKREKAKENEQAQTLAKLKDVNAENKRLRAELKERGGSREQYAELELVVRELRAEVKEKDLSLRELENRVQNLEKELFKAKNEVVELKAENKELKIANHELKNEVKAVKADLGKAEVANKQKDAQIADMSKKFNRLLDAFDKIVDFFKLKVRFGSLEELESDVEKLTTSKQFPTEVLRTLELFQNTGELREATRLLVNQSIDPKELPKQLSKLSAYALAKEEGSSLTRFDILKKIELNKTKTKQTKQREQKESRGYER
jgi:hypothetical protein